MNKALQYKMRLKERCRKIKELDKIVWKAFDKCVKLTDGFYYENTIQYGHYIHTFGIKNLSEIKGGYEKMCKFHEEIKKVVPEDCTDAITYSSGGDNYSVTIYFWI